MLISSYLFKINYLIYVYETKKLPKSELEFITNEAVIETILDGKFEEYFNAISMYSNSSYNKDKHSVESSEEYTVIKRKIDKFMSLENINFPKIKVYKKNEKKNNIGAYILAGGAAINSYYNPFLSAFILAEYFVLKKFGKEIKHINCSHYIPLLKKINLLNTQNTNDTFAHEYGHHISSNILPLFMINKYNYFSEGFSEYIQKFELDNLNFKDFKSIITPSQLMIYKKYKKHEEIKNNVKNMKLIINNPEYNCGLLFFRLFHQICGDEVAKALLVKPSESFKELDTRIKSFDIKSIQKDCDSATNMTFLLERERKKRKN